MGRQDGIDARTAAEVEDDVIRSYPRRSDGITHPERPGDCALRQKGDLLGRVMKADQGPAPARLDTAVGSLDDVPDIALVEEIHRRGVHASSSRA